MILNNYNTIKAIEDDYKEEELTKELLFEFHSMITKDTMEDPNESGRFRREDEDIKVWDHNTILHVPPNVDFMNSEMDRLIKFANDGLSEQTFLHPVAKAIMLHFWIGYLHPFVDGNGRLARLLFYWYLLKKDYWAFSFLPISAVIKNSSEQYKMAYLYSEGDDNDLTYFIDYNVRKIEQAIDEFDAYIKEKYQENARMNKDAVDKYELNERQISLLQYLSSNPTQKNTNTRLHKDINQISRQTAAKDLKELVSLGFMREKKKGRRIIYYGTDKVNKLFR
jgi:Fic family protein